MSNNEIYHPNHKDGSIEVIFGPMFSSKTSTLLKRYRKYKLLNKKCLLIKYSKDTRYNKTGISTHDLNVQQTDVVQSSGKLFNLKTECEQVDMIGIDEGQFYSDIVEFCDYFANLGKIVVVAALDGNYLREPFNDILRLIPISEKIRKKSAVCGVCKDNNASFTMKKIKDNDNIEVIGGSDIYSPVCRDCYNE